MRKQGIPTVRADVGVLEEKVVRSVFNDIFSQKAASAEEITRELNFEKSTVQRTLKILEDADLVKPVSSLQTSAGPITFYSVTRDGIKVMRAIEGGYGGFY